MTAVPDASSLILLGKLERVDLVSALYGETLITPWVWQEAVTVGKDTGAMDAALIEKAAQTIEFSRVRLTTAEKKLAEQLKSSGVGSGEAEVLSVAKVRKALAILDDKDARATAISMDIEHTGTAGILYQAFLRKLIAYEELLGFFEKLGKVAWVSPELLAGIIKRAREVSEQ
jgi:predicted nucleic acid-binding protein